MERVELIGLGVQNIEVEPLRFREIAALMEGEGALQRLNP
jgi:hypothetical protein